MYILRRLLYTEHAIRTTCTVVRIIENRKWIQVQLAFDICLGTETVEGTARALQRIDNVERGDGLPVGNMLAQRAPCAVAATTTNLFACSV